MNGRASPISFFVRHKVAANLLMLIMLGGGVLGLMRMNIQFFPTFALDFVTVRVIWSGAAAEDVEQAITQPLEQRLRNIENLKSMTSTSAQGVASITLEFREGTDPIVALDDARQQVDAGGVQAIDGSGIFLAEAETAGFDRGDHEQHQDRPHAVVREALPHLEEEQRVDAARVAALRQRRCLHDGRSPDVDGGATCRAGGRASTGAIDRPTLRGQGGAGFTPIAPSLPLPSRHDLQPVARTRQAARQRDPQLVGIGPHRGEVVAVGNQIHTAQAHARWRR